MPIKDDIKELIEAGVIGSDTGDAIAAYYANKKPESSNRLFMAFGILGALLVGLGIILIVAHNWDTLGKSAKVFFAFLPVVISQVLAGYTLLKQSKSSTWRESTAVLLFLAIGACISLVSQIYHIPGSLQPFIFTWMLLGLPIIYVMRSAAASLMYLAGITYFVSQGYDRGYQPISPYYYWLMLAALIPFYIQLIRENVGSISATFHHWLVPGSLLVALGTLAHDHPEWMMIAYAALCSSFYLLGNDGRFRALRLSANGLRVIGAIGSIVILLMLTFQAFWRALSKQVDEAGFWTAPEMIPTVLLVGIASYLLYRSRGNRDLTGPFGYVYLLVLICFLAGLFIPFMHVVMNVVLLLVGARTIQYGAQKEHLGILNLGLLIIKALIIARFFDTNISFVLRGIIFVIVGVGFFIANYLMIKKRNADVD